MDAAFTSIPFADTARAEHNLALVERRLPGSLWPSLPTLLAQVPDPGGALNFLERFLREPPPRVLAEMARNPAALHYALVVFSYTRYLSETLVQQPDLLVWLCRTRGAGASPTRSPLERLKSPEDLHEELARFESTSLDQPPAVLLARFKRREYLRILLRDVLGLATLAETTLELSHLADLLLERTLRMGESRLERAYGLPQATDASGRRHHVRLTILSLGKLGGQELNYSSDIDLMFLYGSEGETSGGDSGRIANSEYFVRLAQAVLRLITEITPEGPVYRVDLRLRPQGGEGDLAMGLPAALDYYRSRAREWELQMLIKARCSAGDALTARRFLRELRPLIFRREFNAAAVEAVLNARQQTTRSLARTARSSRGMGSARGEHAEKWNVKLSPGGIRDIEFLTQCLQRLHGGADPWVASPAAAATLVALQWLHDKGYLSGRDFFRLGTAYQFLRRVEHRLQLRDGIQRHTLPAAPDALERLARRCGVEAVVGTPPRTAGEQLLLRITQHFAEVREIYDRVVSPPRVPADAESAASATSASSVSRRLLRQHPALARAAAEASARSGERARRGLSRYLDSALLEPDVLVELEAHPHWLERALSLFDRSEFVAELLARHPAEIAVLSGPAAAGADSAPAWPSGAAAESGMAALRVAYRRGLLRILIGALSGESQPFQTFEELTRLAEIHLAAALDLAAGETLPREWHGSLSQAPFAVVALGRLGTGEMDVGSDADLVFIAGESLRPEDREPWRRLAERFVHVVSSHTREGLLFPVDTRLRPGGTEGEIVQPCSHLREYFSAQAQAWEAVTWLKARPLAGNRELAASSVADVHASFADRLSDPAQLAHELHDVRRKMEKTGRGLAAKGEFKKIPGGYYDIDYLTGFLTLTRGLAAAPRGHILQQIAALESARALDSAQAQALRGAALLYRGVDHALRLITGRPAHRLPESRLAERVYAMLQEWSVPLPGSLEASVDAAREQTRALYDRLLLSVAEPAPAGGPP